MKKELTAEHIWLEIARAYETPPERRTDREHKIATSGLCYALEAVRGCGSQAWYSARSQLHEYRSSNCLPGFFWPIHVGPTRQREYDLKRAALARQFAKECE